jgi:hypothetical protein
MSTAFWLASPRRKRVENERERVRAANDWVIRQMAESGPVYHPVGHLF